MHDIEHRHCSASSFCLYNYYCVMARGFRTDVFGMVRFSCGALMRGMPNMHSRIGERCAAVEAACVTSAALRKLCAAIPGATESSVGI